MTRIMPFYSFRRNIILVFIALYFSHLIIGDAHAVGPLKIDSATKVLNSSELILGAVKYDGEVVNYNGEAVGDLMRRGKENWINVYDGKNAIGIVLSGPQADRITFVGDYKDIGDTLSITGIFNESCELHRGELDIHAKTLTVVEKGYRVPFKSDGTNFFLAGFMSICAAIIFYLSKRKHEAVNDQ